MSDRDGSGRTRRQQLTPEDVLRVIVAFCNDGRRNDAATHNDDPTRPLFQHRPLFSRAISDVVSSNPHLIPQIFASAPTPAKRSEAEEAFDINQRAYVFIEHLDNKEWEHLLGMMTRSIKVPKTECRLVPSFGNKAHFNYTEEPASDYVEQLKSPEGLGESQLMTYHQLGASFITPVSSSEKHAHFQTKIIQTRYANKQYGEKVPNVRIAARANAVMEMTLIFKKEEGEWKVSGMAGFVRWIEFSKPKLIIGINRPEKTESRKKIVENTLRYHRILPGQTKEIRPSQQQLQRNTPQSSRGSGVSLDPRYSSWDDDYFGVGYQGGHPANRRLLPLR